jgi:hypothetical protein
VRRTLVALVALAAFSGLAACGEDDEEDKPRTLRISISDQPGGRFQITAPTSVPAGTTRIEFRNNSRADHEAQLIRVDGNHSLQEVTQFLEREGAPTPPWLHGGGGVAPIKAGQTGVVTQRLQPGTYYVIDDESPEDAPENAPSPYERGATATIQVRDDGGSDAALPKADARVTAVEYGFRTTELKVGRHEVEIDNAGREPHHVIAFPINPGKTINDVRTAFASENEQTQPPVDFQNITGTSVLDGGTKQVATLNFAKAGKYAMVCFIADRAGGPPHAAKGMITEVNVTQ